MNEARQVPCSHCGANVGQPCRRPSGKKLISHHDQRLMALQHRRVYRHRDVLLAAAIAVRDGFEKNLTKPMKQLNEAINYWPRIT